MAERMEINYIFGEAIKQVRLSRGLSQERLALKIGMDRTYYASVESGKRNVSLLNIKKISDGLEMKMAALFEIVDDLGVNRTGKENNEDA